MSRSALHFTAIALVLATFAAVSPAVAMDWIPNSIYHAMDNMNSGQLDKALVDCDRTIQANPMIGGPYLIKGWIYSHRGEDAKAADYAKASLTRMMDFRDIPKAHELLSYSYLKLGQFDLALKESNMAYATGCKTAENYHLRAAAYHGLGKEDSAQAELAQAKKLEAQAAHASK